MAPWRPLETALWWLAAALSFLPFGFTLIQGSDLWWHLAAGRWIWQQQTWPRTDPFSFTRAGEPWHHHEWLSDVVYEAWRRLFGGPASLVYWKWAVLLATFLLLWRLLARPAGGPTDEPATGSPAGEPDAGARAAAWLAALFALATAAPFLDIRPHLWSLLGTVLLLRLTLGRDPARPSWLLPPLFLVWANLHGGVAFGLLALTLILTVDAALAWRAGELRGFLRSRTPLLWAACWLAALVNPYGLEVLTYPLRYALDADSPFRALGEWLPPRVPGGLRAPLYPAAVAAFCLAGLCGFLVQRSRAERRRLLAGLALAGLTLAMSWTSRRFIPLFALCLALLTAPLLAWLTAALERGLLRRLAARPAARLLLPAAIVLLSAAALSQYPLGPRAFDLLTSRESFPVETCNFLRANRLGGRIFALYNWGGYLQLCTGGQARVYVDGRADTVYDDATYRRYLQVHQARTGWERVVEESGAQFVLWRAEDVPVVKSLYESGRWRPIYEDAVSVLFARLDTPLPPLVPTPDSPEQRLAKGMTAFRRGRLDLAEPAIRSALELAPHYLPACRNLAVVQAATGNLPAARVTAAYCEEIFPGAVPPGLLAEIAAQREG